MAEQTIKAQTERLAWVRLPTGQAVSCQAIASSTADEAETAWLGRLRDITVGRLALRTSQFFAPGRLLTIELKVNREARSFPLAIRHFST